MARQIDDLRELELIIARELNSTVGLRGTKSNQLIRDYIERKTEEMVYKFYEPKQYNRRRKNGGLLDPDYLIEETKPVSPVAVKVEFVQTAPGDNPQWEHYYNLSGALNEGYNEQNAPWEKPRGHIDYMNENMVNELGNDIVELLKFDLSAKGYKVR